MLEKQDLEAIDELIRTRIEESEARTNKRFEAVDQRFEAMDKRFEAVDKRFEDLETRMDKRFEEMRGDIWKDVSVLMDAKFEKYFNLLAENQQGLQEKMDRLLGERLPERVEKTEGDVQVLKVAVRHLNEDVGELKAAK